MRDQENAGPILLDGSNTVLYGVASFQIPVSFILFSRLGQHFGECAVETLYKPVCLRVVGGCIILWIPSKL